MVYILHPRVRTSPWQKARVNVGLTSYMFFLSKIKTPQFHLTSARKPLPHVFVQFYHSFHQEVMYDTSFSDFQDVDTGSFKNRNISCKKHISSLSWLFLGPFRVFKMVSQKALQCLNWNMGIWKHPPLSFLSPEGKTDTKAPEANSLFPECVWGIQCSCLCLQTQAQLGIWWHTVCLLTSEEPMMFLMENCPVPPITALCLQNIQTPGSNFDDNSEL